MANLSMIEEHNELFTKISRAKTVEDIRPLVPLVKKFYSMYESIDNTAAERIYEQCAKKLHELVEENEIMFSRMTARAESVSNRMYDFAGEQDDRQAVNNMVLQLISQLPKVKTTATASGITKIIEQSMKSVIGCKAVLELMKYPAYIDMIDERQRQRAFDGSKSESQQTFEKLKEKELAEVNKALSDVYLQGFHLRTLEKQIKDFKSLRYGVNNSTIHKLRILKNGYYRLVQLSKTEHTIQSDNGTTIPDEFVLCPYPRREQSK